MRRLMALTFLIVAIIGCRGDNVVSPSTGIAVGQHPSTDADCWGYSWQCDQVRAGIAYLLQHANESCRAAGQSAQARYDAPPGEAGFAPGNAGGDNDQMYVIMGYPASTPSGQGATDHYTYMQGSYYGLSDAQSGALIAHEEEHQNGDDGINHNTGKAQALQDKCLNNQS